MLEFNYQSSELDLMILNFYQTKFAAKYSFSKTSKLKQNDNTNKIGSFYTKAPTVCYSMMYGNVRKNEQYHSKNQKVPLKKIMVILFDHHL